MESSRSSSMFNHGSVFRFHEVTRTKLFYSLIESSSTNNIGQTWDTNNHQAIFRFYPIFDPIYSSSMPDHILSGSRQGMVNQNSEPSPGLEITPISPLIFRTIISQIESPSPVP